MVAKRTFRFWNNALALRRALCTVTALRILQDPRTPATPLPVELFSAITTKFQMAGIAGFASKKMAPLRGQKDRNKTQWESLIMNNIWKPGSQIT